MHPSAIILIGLASAIAASIAGFYSTLSYRRKARAIRLIRHLQENITLENFQSSFNRKFRRRQAVKPILDVIDAGLLDPTVFGLTPRDIKNLGKSRVSKLIAAYKDSFVAGYWKTYAQTEKGYRAFIQFAFVNEIESGDYGEIRKGFCRRLYSLASHEHIASLDNGAVQKMISKKFDFSTDEIQEWCIAPQEGRPPSRRENPVDTGP